MHRRLVIPKLHVEVLAVRARRHGSAEDGLDEEAVVGLEGRAVGVAEGDGEFLGRELHVLGERDAGEVEAAGEALVRLIERGRRGGKRTGRARSGLR